MVKSSQSIRVQAHALFGVCLDRLTNRVEVARASLRHEAQHSRRLLLCHVHPRPTATAWTAVGAACCCCSHTALGLCATRLEMHREGVSRHVTTSSELFAKGHRLKPLVCCKFALSRYARSYVGQRLWALRNQRTGPRRLPYSQSVATSRGLIYVWAPVRCAVFCVSVCVCGTCAVFVFVCRELFSREKEMKSS